MKNVCTFLLLFLAIQFSLTAQDDPQLWVEGNVNQVSTTDSFEGSLDGYSTGGSSGWTFTTNQASSGFYSASSGIISDNQSSYIEQAFTVPANTVATLSFDLLYTSNYSYGYTNLGVFVSVNGTNVESSGSTSGAFETFSIPLSSGNNLVRWTVINGYSGGYDFEAFLDNVTLTYYEDIAVRIQDGTEGAGKVLTSDVLGNATWQDLNNIFSNPAAIPLTLSADLLYTYLLNVSNQQTFGGYGINVDASYIGITSQNAAYTFYSTGSTYGYFSAGSGYTDFYSYYPDNYGFYSEGSYGYGVYVVGAATQAGRFIGELYASTLSKGSGTFQIDHPLDPENKYLYHSFVESPDMMNIYNGNAICNANGEAIVTMPDYFEPLNKEFRYQLTCIGGYANVYVKEEVADGQFVIAGGTDGLKVSWQLTGIRQDAFAEANRVEVEVDKPDHYKGFYLHPEAHDQPYEKSIQYKDEILSGEIEQKKKDKEMLEKLNAEKSPAQLNLPTENKR